MHESFNTHRHTHTHVNPHTHASSYTSLQDLTSHSPLCAGVYWGISGTAGMPVKLCVYTCWTPLRPWSSTGWKNVDYNFLFLACFGQGFIRWLRPLLIKTQLQDGAKVTDCDSHPEHKHIKNRVIGGTQALTCDPLDNWQYLLVGGCWGILSLLLHPSSEVGY